VQGAPVRWQHVDELGGNAGAQIRDGEGWILWSDRWLALPPAVRVFVLAHERAHIEGIDDELEADCHAIRWMAEADYLSATWQADIIEWLCEQPQSPVHPPGIVRAVRVLECSP
jgi:hypothetical protein